MKYRLLEFLVCPECRGDLFLTVFKEEQVIYSPTAPVLQCSQCSRSFGDCRSDFHENTCRCCYQKEIKEGILRCSHNHLFPIIEYIPRMLPDAFNHAEEFVGQYKQVLPLDAIERKMQAERTKEYVKTQKNVPDAFGYQWMRYRECLEDEDEKIFYEDSQMSGDELRGKRILDAGCGMGRYTRIAGRLGEEVMGVDISISVLKAYQVTRGDTLVHIIQGDIMNLPFRGYVFDIIYSLGVLHHTPDARRSFLKLVTHLKRGGVISVWVYGTAGRLDDFKTNPLKEERKKYFGSPLATLIHWNIVKVREETFRLVRLITTRMSKELLYLNCYLLAALGKVPLVKYFTASVHPRWRVRLQENFDWFSPRYQSHHTKEEVISWFEEAQVKVVSMLAHGFIPKVGIKGILT